MKKWTVLPLHLLLAAMAAAQPSAPIQPARADGQIGNHACHFQQQGA